VYMLRLLRFALLAIGLCSGANAQSDLDKCPLSHLIPKEILESRLTIFGELHGTKQVPVFVGSHVCTLLSMGREVSLILEVGMDEQSRIDIYLKSQGSAADRAALLAGNFWTRPRPKGKSIQDGRASEAMMSLIEYARQQRRATNRLTIRAASAHKAGQNTDEMMANAIRESVALNPAGYTVALMGGVHASTAKGTPWDPNYESVGFRLRDLLPMSVNTAHSGGSTWACMASGCHEHQLFELPSVEGMPVGYAASTREGFQWSFMLGRVSASPPAVPE
jgi:hypothetical protein